MMLKQDIKVKMLYGTFNFNLYFIKTKYDSCILQISNLVQFKDYELALMNVQTIDN